MVNCAEHLARYNQDRKLLDIDYRLYTGFSTVHDITSLHPMIDELVKAYGLQRQRVLDEQSTSIIAQYLNEMRSLPNAGIDSIDIISNKFYTLKDTLSHTLKRHEPFPEVSLSKLLHFIH